MLHREGTDKKLVVFTEGVNSN